MLTSAKLDATGHRWVANLSEYNFDIIYRSGPSNRDADALSRISWPQNLQEVSQPVVHALCQNVTTDSCAVESCTFDDVVVPDLFESSSTGGMIDWHQEQANDPAISCIIDCLVNVSPWPTGPNRSQELKSLVKEKSRLRIKNNLLYRERSTGDRDSPTTEFQLVILAKFRKEIMEFALSRLGIWDGSEP